MLKRMIDELMEGICGGKLDVDTLRGKLKAIKTQIGEALSINVSSEKLMTFLLEDTMDLAALRMKKFKRNDSVFAVKELFQEVMSILAFKAEHKLIEVSLSFTCANTGLVVSAPPLWSGVGVNSLFVSLTPEQAPESCGFMYWDPLVTPTASLGRAGPRLTSDGGGGGDDDDGDGINVGGMVGGIVGGLSGLIGGISGGLWYLKKKKKQRVQGAGPATV